MIFDIFEYVVVAVLGLLPIANPFSTAPLFIGLTSNMTELARRKVAAQACLYMATVLIVFLLAGTLVLSFFGITINGLRTAGGLIIGFIGFRMLFPPEKALVATDDPGEPGAQNIAFTPLAMPMLSGPGAIAVVIGLAAEVAAHEIGDGLIFGYLLIAIGILLTAAICWLVLRASGSVVRFLGKSGIDALSRVMGFFLVCIGVEFIAGGVQGLALMSRQL